MNPQQQELAACAELGDLLAQLAKGLDHYLRFEDEDAMVNAHVWRKALGIDLPEEGIGIHPLMRRSAYTFCPTARRSPSRDSVLLSPPVRAQPGFWLLSAAWWRPHNGWV
ncbi:hypothetical protein [Kineobactrum salinum]|uniref:hypothetical protein n=1 Tax=Kineobactrum salinum TaxID=2708301 RepID=UPI0018D85F01|nr:hypothetical protein [Kineobactrum salinum]